MSPLDAMPPLEKLVAMTLGWAVIALGAATALQILKALVIALWNDFRIWVQLRPARKGWRPRRPRLAIRRPR